MVPRFVIKFSSPVLLKEDNTGYFSFRIFSIAEPAEGPGIDTSPLPPPTSIRPKDLFKFQFIHIFQKGYYQP